MSNSSKPYDLIVVGGGVLGSFFAYQALEQQHRVLLVDKNQPPKGASVRNFGQLVPSGMNGEWQVHGRRSLEIYRSIQQTVDLTLRDLGSIYIASDDQELTLLEELHAIANSRDYLAELWTAQQCRDRYPQLKRDYCRAGLFFPTEASVNPRQMLYRLHQFLEQQTDFESQFETCVNRVGKKANGRTEVHFGDGRCEEASRVVICSGSEFQILFPERFQKSDLVDVKLQMLRLKPQKNVSLPGNILTGLSIRRYESFSECPSWEKIKSSEPEDSPWKKWGVHILFKQEVDGGIIVGDSHEYAKVASPQSFGHEIQFDINEYMIQEGQKILDLPAWDIEATWYGQYCQTENPSGIVTDAVDDSIHIVTGIGGKGMTSSAGFAEHYYSKWLS